MTKAKSGGGITSNKNVRPPVRCGQPTTSKIRPGAVSQIGSQVVLTNTTAGKLVSGTAKQEPLGNQTALNAKPTVYDRGTQGRQGTEG